MSPQTQCCERRACREGPSFGSWGCFNEEASSPIEMLSVMDEDPVISDPDSGSEAENKDTVCIPHQREVGEFIRDVSRGRKVTLVRTLGTDPFVERLPATMTLSRDRKRIVFSHKSREVCMELSSVTDTSGFGYGATGFSEDVVQYLTEHERLRLVRMAYTAGGGTVKSLLFMEPRPASVDACLTGMRALRVWRARRDRECGRRRQLTVGLDAA